MLGRLLLAVSMMLALPGAAWAQALSCHVGSPLPRPVAGSGAEREGGRRVVPVTGYTLSLNWSPEYCRTRTSSARDAVQCGAGERFGFILHGLWPEGHGREWPQYCRPASLLPAAVIRSAICATPSVQLQQHEWEKHGSCTGSDPAAYFAEATRLYAGIHYPDMEALSRARTGAGGLARAFAEANPGLPAGAIQVVANRRGWLEEVRLCLDRSKAYVACPADWRVEAAASLKIWRGGAPGRARGAPGLAHRPDDGDRADVG